MNLIPEQFHAELNQPFADLQDTFGRKIYAISEIKTPKTSTDQDFDFTNPNSYNDQSFDYSYVETEIVARIKYIEKQDKEFAMITTLGGEQINLVQEFGILRIKVHSDFSDIISDASSIKVDGDKCKVIFRDRPHGLISANYRTFYLQRVP